MKKKKNQNKRQNPYKLPIIFLVLIVTFSLFLLANKLINIKISKNPKASGIKSPYEIIGGHKADKDEWPFMVILLFDYKDEIALVNNENKCGGTLINKNWILTAGHCVVGEVDKNNIFVGIGLTDLTDYDNMIPTEKLAHRRNIKQIIIHENYSSYKGHYINDIALIELDSPVDLPTISINNSNYLETEKNLVAILGWGYNNLFSLELPNNLLEAFVPIISNDKANQPSWYQGTVTDSEIVAGFTQGSVDSCGGDSGGPVLAWNGNKWLQIGIITWGWGCALPFHPGVGTRISKYTDWIYDNTGIKPNSGSFTGNYLSQKDLEEYKHNLLLQFKFETSLNRLPKKRLQ